MGEVDKETRDELEAMTVAFQALDKLPWRARKRAITWLWHRVDSDITKAIQNDLEAPEAKP